MRLIQAKNAAGTIVPGVIQGDEALLVERSAPGDELSADAVHDTLGLLTAVDRGDTTLAGWLADAKRAGRIAHVAWTDLAAGRAKGWTLTMPLTPPEVWGAGVTYRRSADFREEGLGIYDGAGIHGTDQTYSLGTAASHGCIRMAIPDVIELYDQVPVGAPIYIAFCLYLLEEVPQFLDFRFDKTVQCFRFDR